MADRIAAIIVWTIPLLVAVFFAWLLTDLLRHGTGQVTTAFLVSPVRDAGRAGGIGPVLVSTALILAVCIVVALPIALGTAILLAEFTPGGTPFGRIVRRSLDILAGVPSIVFGLFGNAFFSKVLGLGFSIASGGLTLACMVLPLLIRTTEEGFRTIPDDVRHGATALGLSRFSTVRRVLLPLAVPALAVGLVLSVGRAVAETAALIFTSGSVDRLPASFLDSGRSLSVHIYDLSMNVAGGEPNAWGSALVLVVLLLGINTVATGVARRWSGTETSR